MSFTVNVISRQNLKEFTKHFQRQIFAELYIRDIDAVTTFDVTEWNFNSKFSNEELDAFRDAHLKVLVEARRLEKQARDRTKANWANPDWNPCEVCGKKHRNHNCCERCNMDNHRCHFCGEALGHREFSVCYIMMPWEE